MRDNIFVMAKKSIKKGIFPLLEIIYISDYNKFELHEKKINFELIKRFKTVFLKYNYSEGNGISSKNFLFRKITKKKIFYLNKPKNFKFDVLYSELLS